MRTMDQCDPDCGPITERTEGMHEHTNEDGVCWHENDMTAKDTGRWMRTERPVTGAGVPAWDCITRDRLRAWIAERRWQDDDLTNEEVGFQQALDSLEAFVNQGA